MKVNLSLVTNTYQLQRCNALKRCALEFIQASKVAELKPYERIQLRISF